MRNLFLIFVLMSGVANAQWYGSVGASAGQGNFGTFWKVGITTDDSDNFSVASEASINFMASNSFLKAAVIPQYEVSNVRLGLGATTYWSNTFFGTTKWTGGLTSKAEYLYSDDTTFSIGVDRTRELGNIYQLGIHFIF
jgi:hypothetical protein